MFALGTFAGAGLLVSAVLAFAGAFGAPRWLLSYLRKRRETKFLDHFPDAVDVIVRGIKAGLPLLDCIKMIVSEAPDPIKTEFRLILETQAIGMPLARPAENCTSARRCQKQISSESSLQFSKDLAAISPKRSGTCRRFCAIAKK